MRYFNWFSFCCWTVKVSTFFDRHPWDWVAHLILGFISFMVQWAILMCFIAGAAKLLAIWGTIVALFTVEFVQIDIFGLNKIRFIDTVIDLIFGFLGFIFAVKLLILF